MNWYKVNLKFQISNVMPFIKPVTSEILHTVSSSNELSVNNQVKRVDYELLIRPPYFEGHKDAE